MVWLFCYVCQNVICLLKPHKKKTRNHEILSTKMFVLCLNNITHSFVMVHEYNLKETWIDMVEIFKEIIFSISFMFQVQT